MAREKKWRGRLIALLLAALLAPAATGWLVEWLPSLHKLELLAYAWHCRSLPRQPADGRIVLIGMDDASLEKLPIERRAYPLPRSIHARLVDELREAGAGTIAFDVMFIRPAPREDPVLAAAIRRHGKVIGALLPHVHVEGGEERLTFERFAPLLRPWLIPASVLVPRRFGAGLWFDPYPVDSETTVRYLHLSVAAVSCYFDENKRRALVRDRFRLGRIDAPIGADGEILIRYAGPAGMFQPIPYHEVFNGEWKRKRGADFFRNKIVLVGVVDSITDRHDTPLGDMQGLEIHANAAQTLLQGNWLRHWSVLANYLVATALCLLVSLAVWRLGLAPALGAALGLALAWLLAAHQLFLHAGIWADTVEPHGALAATYVAAAAIEARRMRRVFHRFMPSWVAERMLESGGNEAPETAEQEVSVVFCDVRNYTTLSETLPAATIEELLHRYFLAGEEAAQRLGTELDKFVGDEIMLYFQPRPGHEPHALRAVRWALAMQNAAERISQTGLAGELGFRVGVGICTGPVRVGTVGARSRIQHTVIGDAVNTASRPAGRDEGARPRYSDR